MALGTVAPAEQTRARYPDEDAIIDELTAQRVLVTSEIVPTLARPTP